MGCGDSDRNISEQQLILGITNMQLCPGKTLLVKVVLYVLGQNSG